MFNTAALVEEVEIEGSRVKAIQDVRYLGKLIMGSGDLMPEIIRRIRERWIGFGKFNSVLKNKKIPLCLKRNVFISCILPALTHGVEAWTLYARMV